MPLLSYHFEHKGFHIQACFLLVQKNKHAEKMYMCLYYEEYMIPSLLERDHLCHRSFGSKDLLTQNLFPVIGSHFSTSNFYTLWGI